MNYFLAGILRIVILEASAALLVMERAIDRAATRLRRRRKIASMVVAALAVYAFTEFGELRGGGPLVHPWEQYHFFLGSKYLREVGYFDLYKATFLADREGAGVLGMVGATRDLHTFDVVDLERGLADAAAVRARFTDERWAEFKADWERLSQWPMRWSEILSDHGNSGSPAWAVVALPFVELFGSSRAGQEALGLIDMVLVVGLFAFLALTFGAETTSVGLTIFCMAPFVFNYLAGSILRWDWLFAVGMALAFWQRRQPFVAGTFLGYAIVSKLFPVFFLVTLGVWLAAEALRRRRLHPGSFRLFGGVALSAIVFVGASAAAFGGLGIWQNYRERIAVTQHEKFYANQYSLQTVYLQATESTTRELTRGFLKPRVIKQSEPNVDVAQHRTGLLVVRLILTLLVLAAVVRSSSLEALAVGPFLIFVWLTVNAYYWNMLGLTALGLAARQFARGDRLSAGLFALHVVWAAYYLYQHLNAGYAEGYFVAVLLLATLVVWAAQALISPARPDAA